jgi:hypothetical protein
MQALYFPYVYFPDSQWLFSSALYWDGIGRIIPPTMTLDDPDHVRLFVDSGAVFDVPLGVDAVSDTSEHLQALLNRPDSMDALRRLYQVADLIPAGSSAEFAELEFFVERVGLGALFVPREPGLTRRIVRDDTGESHGGWGPNSPFFLHVSKFAPEARVQLLELGLAVRYRDLLGLRIDLARAYMSDLAENVASKNALMPVAGAAMDFVHIGGSAIESLVAGIESVRRRRSDVQLEPDIQTESLFAQYAFRGVGLQVPLFERDKDYRGDLLEYGKTVLKLRKSVEPYRFNFQAGLRAAAAELPDLLSIEDQAMRERHLETTFKKHIQSDLDKIRRELSSAGLAFHETVLNMQVAVPAVLAGSATTVGIGLSQPLIFLGGSLSAALGTYKAVRGRRLGRAATLQDSPFALLHVVQGELGPTELLKSVGAAARRLLRRDLPPWS